MPDGKASSRFETRQRGIGDIANADPDSMPKAHVLAVVREFCGHGIGARLFHEDPEGRPLRSSREPVSELKRPNMIFTIEPMINIGKPHAKVLEDGWTAVTRDRSLSAQFEHSIGITETRLRDFYRKPEGAG
jgi:methionyl aminopeptidase